MTEHRETSLRTRMASAETDIINRALKGTLGNVTHAALELGISRSTMSKRIRALGIDAAAFRATRAADVIRSG
ncbi:hypothetical protein LCGC14_1150650 [marine sediment metagenome]|uniref:DNA binding HTH domain-containing protein n=1 Tax=marine sediment metagenome TaxID=412755 RepID=A0A0F9M0I2_9ZZZZ